MGFPLVHKSVTLNDLERRNSPNGCVISPHLATFRAHYLSIKSSVYYIANVNFLHEDIVHVLQNAIHSC